MPSERMLERFAKQVVMEEIVAGVQPVDAPVPGNMEEIVECVQFEGLLGQIQEHIVDLIESIPKVRVSENRVCDSDGASCAQA